ncbi:DUF262 domain-containing protein [bacterium]|nr:DUF262 domain-containing protein [bacterium]
MTKRRQNFENIAWFKDQHDRKRLDMDPPFQRRSVWTRKYREDFIDTILLDYPAPAIFLFSSISDTGATNYQLVDGKQRLETIFGFIGNRFPVGEQSPILRLRGKYFEHLSRDEKVAFFDYDFSVEYLPTNDEQVIDAIFDRLNRNVAKLTAQELRHARFGGRFIKAAEDLSAWMETRLGKNFPRITETSRNQMKDVEVAATLLLLLEEGPKGHSTTSMDEAFSNRDEEWEQETVVVDEFRSTVEHISSILANHNGEWLASSRLRNQADFYSFFGAVAELSREKTLPPPDRSAARLRVFLENFVETPVQRAAVEAASDYYDAARSASNDHGPRRKRISILKRVLKGQEFDGAK